MDNNNPLDNMEELETRSVPERFFDNGSFCEIDRLATSLCAGWGTVGGRTVYAFVQSSKSDSGAVTAAQARTILKLYELAAQNGAPVLAVYDSNGIKLDDKLEGMDALSRILSASAKISGVTPQVAVIAGACVGSAALIAANADITIGIKGADYYLNPGDTSTPTDITAEDMDSALAAARSVLALLPSNNLESAPALEAPALCSNVQTADDIIDSGTGVELCTRGDSRALLARIGGIACGVLKLCGDKIEGTSGLARFVRLCDSFSLPVVTFVDAGGFACFKGAAKLAHAYAQATTAKLTVITGRAYGSVYIAAAGKTAGAEVVFAWPQACVLALAPEAAVPLLWADRLKGMTDPVAQRQKLYDEYAAQEGSAENAARGGYVTDIIQPDETAEKLIAAMDMLSGKRKPTLPRKHSNIML